MVRTVKCSQKVAVIGGGLVGLHVNVHAALSGVKEVIIIDKEQEVVRHINSGDPSWLYVREQYITQKLG